MTTIYEVSKLAGVSLATVSRVMNGNDNVRPKTRDKVLAAIKELDYTPNSVAKSLASNKTDSVGVLVSELHGPIFGSMMSEIEKTLRAKGKHVIFTPGHSDKDTEREGIEFLLSRNCDALIIHAESLSDKELIELDKKSNAAFIYINRYIPELADQCIYLDNFRGGYLAAKNLLEHGHKDIAYISGPLWNNDSLDRLHGHQKAIQETGLVVNDALMATGDFHENSGYQAMTDLLATGIPFTAVACGNDEMAAGALRAITDAGKKVPGDMSCVGYDNIIFTRYMNPKLTTIHYPVDEMGKSAAELVMHLRYGQGDLDSIPHQFEPRLIERESVIPA